MNRNQNDPQWKIDMNKKTKDIERIDQHNVDHLFHELERIANKYLSQNDMMEGDSYTVPFKDGSSITFSFYKDNTALHQINNDGTTSNMILHKDGAEHEKAMLAFISNIYKNIGFGIGEPYSKEFVNKIQETNVGDTITFSYSKKMYVCTHSNDDGSIKDFQKIPIGQFSGSLNDFKSTEHLTINLTDWRSIQSLYDANKDNRTDRCECRAFAGHEAQEWINKIIANTETGKSRTVDFAGIRLIAQKQEDKSLRWYDSSMKSVEESLVKVCLSYFKTAPVTRICESNIIEPSNREHEEAIFLTNLENAYGNADFENAINIIKNECRSINTGFVYKEETIVEETDYKFIPKSFVFFYKDGEVQVKEIKYEDNNYNKPISKLESSSFDGLIAARS